MEVTRKQSAPSRVTRLTVNLNEEATSDLTELADRHGRSFTETVRRLISVGKFLDDEIDQGRVVQILDKDANQVRELVIR